MNQPGHTIEMDELKKGLQRVGLSLKEPELRELSVGNNVSLGKMDLGTIGSLFILASAASAFNLGRSQPIAFQDLPKATQHCKGCSGIPFYCWQSDGLGKLMGKRCLYLTIVDGKPAVKACCHTSLETITVEKGLYASPTGLKS